MLAIHDFIMSSEESNIRSLLQAYRENLTTSNAPGCVALYTTDGATMAQNFQTQIGMDAIKKWYGLCFSLIALDVEFEIQEIVVASPEWAFARTTSTGTQKKLESGEVSQEKNQELFVLQKVESEWKIARYCFCTTNPPAN